MLPKTLLEGWIVLKIDITHGVVVVPTPPTGTLRNSISSIPEALQSASGRLCRHLSLTSSPFVPPWLR